MKFTEIFTYSAKSLKAALHATLIGCGYKQIHNKEKFLYAEGNAPYMLVAHLDTVHKETPSIICYSRDRNYIMSPQGIGGDDRCGVYIILSLLNKLSFKPHIVFTMDEEVGGIGAKEFVKYMEKFETPDLKYIVEFDRKGNKDCVFYQCDNPKFTDFVEQFGFKKATGTFSDISVIAPAFKTAAVNLSSGYYNAHTNHEYISMVDMKNIIDAALKMLSTECEKFEYIKVKFPVYHSCAKSGRIRASFLEPNEVLVWDFIKQDYRMNRFKEIAVDKLGNLYQYSVIYKDYSPIIDSLAVYPLEDDFEPEFNDLTAVTIIVYQ